jgi:hypothetical protein
MANGYALGTLDEQQLRRLHDYLTESVAGAGQTQERQYQIGEQGKERQAMADALREYQASLQPKQVPNYPTEIPQTGYGPQISGRATTPWGTISLQPSSEERRAAGEKAVARMLMSRTLAPKDVLSTFISTLPRGDTSTDLNELVMRASQGDPIAQAAVERRFKYEKGLKAVPRPNIREFIAIGPEGKRHRYRDHLDERGMSTYREDLGLAGEPGGRGSTNARLKKLEADKKSWGALAQKKYPGIDFDEILTTGVIPRRFVKTQYFDATPEAISQQPSADPNDPENADVTQPIPEVEKWLKAVEDYEAYAETLGEPFTPAEQLAAEKPARQEGKTAGAEPAIPQGGLPPVNSGETKQQYIRRLKELGYTISE